MRTILAILLASILILTLIAPGTGARAQSGTPNSPEFGFGVRVNLNGQEIEGSLAAIGSLGFDWVAVDFDWGQLWPDPALQPDLRGLNQAMEAARINNVGVMLSISNAPVWATTEQGPDANLTGSLVLALKRLYPQTLHAVELFPAPNTFQGWGAPVNPAQYALLLQTTNTVLQGSTEMVTLVTGGLVPFVSQQGDMQDLAFLEALYQAGAGEWMPVVGLRLPALSGEPLAMPGGDGHLVLRHYEEVRSLMLQHDQRDSLIWITGFSWPGDLLPAAPIQQQEAEQARWLLEAYQLVRAQLYIGVAFFDTLNPSDMATSNSLVRAGGSYHPVFNKLSMLMSAGAQNDAQRSPGTGIKRTPKDPQLTGMRS